MDKLLRCWRLLQNQNRRLVALHCSLPCIYQWPSVSKKTVVYELPMSSCVCSLRQWFIQLHMALAPVALSFPTEEAAVDVARANAKAANKNYTQLQAHDLDVLPLNFHTND